jgi:nitrite reductase/ring-hydroxylating ferredoxin subunit
MQVRERALARRTTPDRTAPPIDLGDEPSVRAMLPMQFELGGVMFRLIDLEGTLVAHSAVCPHWLGPLDAAPVVEGSIRCPWHGYVFDLVDGRCRSQPALKLAAPPDVRLVDGRVVAEWR